ncbi:MAG: tetratricopeptide repeat protein [Vitreoscilla sp.]|nr:tetratricopeptide repeat protein [Vitreoscilla sp.]
MVLGFCLAQTAAAQASQAPTDASEIQRLIKDGQHVQALKQIDEALARNPKDAQMRFRRGVALSMLDRKAEALAVFQKLVEDHPDMPAPYNNMAVIYGAQGEYEKARGALERAIRTNPAYATAYQNLGDVYAQLASQAYSKALQLDKTDTTVQPKLSLLRELTGSTPTAVVAAKPTAPAVATAAVAAPAPKPTLSSVAAATPAAPVSATPVKSVAAASAPVAAVANSSADVEHAVKAWAAAWSRRDMAAYVAAYSGDFTGQASSHKAWEQERRDRITSKKSIRVGVSDLKIAVNGDKASAKFRQTYESDALSTTSRKTLELARTGGGKWVIRREASGG